MSLPIAILAGGMASRLRPLTETIPKSLVDVTGRPFVVHQLELLQRNKIDRIVLCIGHLGEKIQEVLGDGSRFGVHIDYVSDGLKLLGTGGALKKALPFLGDAFFVLYGDSYLETDYQVVQRAFAQSGKTGLMTVYRNDGRWDRSNVLLRDHQIVRYDKRQPTSDMRHIDYGLGILSRKAFSDVPEDECFDLEEIYQDLIVRGELIGFEVAQRFYEIGSPAGLEETRSYLSCRRIG